MRQEHPECASTMRRLASQQSAYEVVAEVVQFNPTVESMTLVSYVEGPTWRDLLQTRDGPNVESPLNGLQQDRGERILTNLPRKGVSAGNLRGLAESLPDDRLLAVASKVLLAGGGAAHIPMMDFMCVPSPRNLGVLVDLLGNLRQGRGYLLESGRSYHYYGFQLLVEEAWKVFLGKCLLMSGYTDERYVGHQLVDGHCVLRLSSGKLKASVPTVVAEVP